MLRARPCCALPPICQHSQVLVSSRPRTACSTKLRCRAQTVVINCSDDNAAESAAATASRPMQPNQQLADTAAADTATAAAADPVTLQPDWQLTLSVRLAVIRAAQRLCHTNNAHYLHLLQTKQWQQLMDMVVYSVLGLWHTVTIGGVVHHEPATAVLQVPVPASTALPGRQPVTAASAADKQQSAAAAAAAGPAAEEGSQAQQQQQQQQQPSSPETLQVMLVGTSDNADSRCYSIAAKLAELMWADGSSSTPIEAIHLQSWLATVLVCLVNGEQVPPAMVPQDALPDGSSAFEGVTEDWRRWQLQEEAAIASVKGSSWPGLQLSIPVKGLAGLPGAEALAAAQSSVRAAAEAVQAAAELAAELQISDSSATNSSSRSSRSTSSNGVGGSSSASTSRSSATAGNAAGSSSTDDSRRRRRTRKSSKR